MIKTKSKHKDSVPQRIKPQLIRMDLDTQARCQVDMETFREYIEAMERGDIFPPIIVFFDTKTQEYILADGFHRLLAHLEARPNDLIAVEQYLGTAKDALRYAVGANHSHGLRRTNEDKRNAVEICFIELEMGNQSDRQISKIAGVGYDLVSRIRKLLVAAGRLSDSGSRIGADGRTINTANIGKTVECCNDCGNYKRGGCLLDGEDYPPTNSACEEFSVPLEVIDDRGRAVYYESDDDPNDKKEVRHRVSRRHKGEYVRVPLDKTNTDRAAVEIRLFLGENYLSGLVQSAIRILEED